MPLYRPCDNVPAGYPSGTARLYSAPGTVDHVPTYSAVNILAPSPLKVMSDGRINIASFLVDPVAAVDNDVWFRVSGGILELRRRQAGVNRGVELE